MERITSRKNRYITHLRALADNSDYRRECGEFLCDGYKLLEDALNSNAEISSVLWKENVGDYSVSCSKQYVVDEQLFDYASPMKNSPGPLFTCRIPNTEPNQKADNAIIVETLQDPGNVGTILRTANAMGIDAVILTGACADIYSPKVVRASMGAIFRQRVFRFDYDSLRLFLNRNNMKLYGAALSDRAENIRRLNIADSAVAIGSEGRGLSAEMLSICDSELIIPMQPSSESLNAAVAASIIMWEMSGGKHD